MVDMVEAETWNCEIGVAKFIWFIQGGGGGILQTATSTGELLTQYLETTSPLPLSEV